jgi:hypothetical protein
MEPGEGDFICSRCGLFARSGERCPERPDAPCRNLAYVFESFVRLLRGEEP